MATIASVSRERKNALKAIMAASLKLDARQETLEREVKRLRNRKRSIPEVSDMVRLIGMADATAAALNDMVGVIKAASQSFTVV